MLGDFVIYVELPGTPGVAKKKKQHKTFPLGGFCQTVLSLSKSHVGQLRVSHGLMSGNFGSNLGPHLATWAPAWAHVERFGGLCGAPWNSRGRKKKQHTTFPLGVFLSLFCGYVSPMLRNLGSHMG